VIPAPLVYLLAGLVVLGVAHRAVRPLSWRAALVLLLLPLAFTGKALLTGRVFGPLDIAYQAPPLKALAAEQGIEYQNGALSDVHCQLTPWGKAVRWAYTQGEWPLWNPFMFSGDILAASSSPGPYEPANLATLLAPLADRLGLTASLSMLFAGLTMFLFLRELGCRDSASLLAAVGWMFCDFRIFWIGLPQTPTVACLPLVLLAVRRICARVGASEAVLLTVALVLVVLPGHPESTAHVVLLGVLYALWLLARGRAAIPAGRRLRWFLQTIGAAVAAGALALALAAVHLLPLLDALDQSIEHKSRAAMYAQMDRSAPWSELGARLAYSFTPFVFGRPGWALSADAPRGLDPAGGYAGSLLLPLAVFGLFATRARERWILLALGALGLFASASAPIVADLLAEVPPYDLAINERLGFSWAFAVSALAGLGAEAWAKVVDRRRLAGLALVVCGVLAAGVLATAPTVLGGRLAPELFQRFSGWLLLPPLAVWALARWWRPAGSALAAMLVLLVAQRVGEMGDVYGSFPRAAFFPRPPVLAQLPEIGGAGGAEVYRVVGRAFTLIPNAAAMWEIEDPRGYQAITHSRLAATLPLWSTQMPVWFNMVPKLDVPFLSFLNVRYAIADPDTPAEKGWKLRYRGPDASLFVNPRALPRAFVPQRVRVGGSGATVLREMAAETSFRRRGWIELPAVAGAETTTGIRNGPGRVRSERQGSGYLLDADMQAPGWVIVSVTHWRGWHARLDETSDLPLAFGNHAFLAFELPAGQHRVRLWYLPASFVWGRALSLGSLAALLLWWGAVQLRRRLRGPERLGVPS
jgi:hypothetical protein